MMALPRPTTLFLLLLSFVGTIVSQDEPELPDLLDSDDIAYFFHRNELEDLHWALSTVFRDSQRHPHSNKPLPEQLVARGGGSTYTTQYKLELDLEQAEYLVETLDNEEERDYFRNNVIPIYQSVLQNIPPLDQLERTHGLYAFTARDYELGIQNVYNKALHHTDFDTLRDAHGNALPLLNPKLDLDKIQQQWHDEGIVVIDDLLCKAALDRIFQLMLTSTVWFQTKMPLKFGGYVGAYIDDGLYDRILLELAKELSVKLDGIFENHPLKYMWAYKYDSQYSGIHTHADEAAVNVNIWLTPDDANLDPSSGGLVVYTAKPPLDMDFARYNTDTEFVREFLLQPTDFANHTIPYKQNRAVMFDSALFHHTDEFSFRKAYKNRRINLTLLYGNMQKASPTKEEL